MRSIREYFGMRALINCFAFFAVTLSSNTNLGRHTSSSMQWKLRYSKSNARNFQQDIWFKRMKDKSLKSIESQPFHKNSM